MKFTKQDRHSIVTLSAANGEGSGSLGREMLRCAQHDRAGCGR